MERLFIFAETYQQFIRFCEANKLNPIRNGKVATYVNDLHQLKGIRGARAVHLPGWSQGKSSAFLREVDSRELLDYTHYFKTDV